MKKFYIFIAVFVLCFGVVFAFLFTNNNLTQENLNDEFLRIHIRANSNESVDQNVKYKVKDAFVNALTPLLVDADTKQKAECIISNNLSMLTTIANQVLASNGFSYQARCFLKREQFPTRTYESLTLLSGVYDALIVELGSAKGDNWWCVVYPPMCFVNGSDEQKNVVYKSKLAEIIRSFFKKE